MRTTTLDGPLGPVTVLADDEGLHAVLFDAPAPPDAVRDDAALREARTQLEEWFAGTRTSFDLPLAPARTPFAERVRALLRQVPYGTTTTYGALARELGGPGVSRAVGTACARNPLAVVVPCHRVVAADGTLTGFAAGLPRKRWLIDHEQRGSGATLL